MNSKKSIKQEQNKIVKNMLFIKVDITKNPFNYLEEEIYVPIISEEIKKDFDNMAIAIEVADTIIASGVLISVLKDKEIYIEYIKKSIKELDDIDKNLLMKKLNNKFVGLFYTEGLYNNRKIIGLTEEDTAKILDKLTYYERYILENYKLEETEELIKNYQIHLSAAYNITSNGKYMYYLGKTYEYQNQFLKAMLIYKKALNESCVKVSQYEEIRKALEESIDYIYEQSEKEKLDYMKSMNWIDDN
ncbi:MAG: hypothetical protein MSH08_08000 [Ezakiella sp.]|nr:hypothetical protein [Ezakiella sp.]MDD7471582.1 hypothetical protein [Bacillota bacterium]MDY3922818.1 hypothetical protein [Ezakiella sp.]